MNEMGDIEYYLVWSEETIRLHFHINSKLRHMTDIHYIKKELYDSNAPTFFITSSLLRIFMNHIIPFPFRISHNIPVFFSPLHELNTAVSVDFHKFKSRLAQSFDVSESSGELLLDISTFNTLYSVNYTWCL